MLRKRSRAVASSKRSAKQQQRWARRTIKQQPQARGTTKVRTKLKQNTIKQTK